MTTDMTKYTVEAAGSILALYRPVQDSLGNLVHADTARQLNNDVYWPTLRVETAISVSFDMDNWAAVWTIAGATGNANSQRKD